MFIILPYFFFLVSLLIQLNNQVEGTDAGIMDPQRNGEDHGKNT